MIRLHAALYVNAAGKIVQERHFDADADVSIGGDATASFVVPGWVGTPEPLISAGAMLHLRAGMRVNMCDDRGSERIIGTYEELLASGVSVPIPINMRRMNIQISEGVSVFAKYVDDGDGNYARALETSSAARSPDSSAPSM